MRAAKVSGSLEMHSAPGPLPIPMRWLIRRWIITSSMRTAGRVHTRRFTRADRPKQRREPVHFGNNGAAAARLCTRRKTEKPLTFWINYSCQKGLQQLCLTGGRQQVLSQDEMTLDALSQLTCLVDAPKMSSSRLANNSSETREVSGKRRQVVIRNVCFGTSFKSFVTRLCETTRTKRS